MLYFVTKPIWWQMGRFLRKKLFYVRAHAWILQGVGDITLTIAQGDDLLPLRGALIVAIRKLSFHKMEF